MFSMKNVNHWREKLKTTSEGGKTFHAHGLASKLLE
jgi:hypothetical protein